MREKILSLAKGNFIYETPKLCLSIEKLVFEVTAGTHGTASFFLENSFGTRVKGFGTVEEMCIDFLPFFDGTKNELTVDVDAGELNPGEKLKGNLDLITDCGEKKLPYEITIVSPVLRDEEGERREFTLETTELRQVLGEDVPLDTPDVVLWIKDYLSEQTAELLEPGSTQAEET